MYRKISMKAQQNTFINHITVAIKARDQTATTEVINSAISDWLKAAPSRVKMRNKRYFEVR